MRQSISDLIVFTSQKRKGNMKNIFKKCITGVISSVFILAAMSSYSYEEAGGCSWTQTSGYGDRFGNVLLRWEPVGNCQYSEMHWTKNSGYTPPPLNFHGFHVTFL